MSIRPAAFSPVGASLALALGCQLQPGELAPKMDSGTTIDATKHDGGAGEVAGFELLGAPLIFAPTPRGFGVNAVLRTGDPSALRLRVRDEAQPDWSEVGPPMLRPATDIAQWSVTGLEPGRRYGYEICLAGDGNVSSACQSPLYSGSAPTARPPGTTFTFAAMADSHIEPRDPVPPGMDIVDDSFAPMETTLRAVTGDIAAADPDFIVDMGDLVDYHLFGFNTPPPDAAS